MQKMRSAEKPVFVRFMSYNTDRAILYPGNSEPVFTIVMPTWFFVTASSPCRYFVKNFKCVTRRVAENEFAVYFTRNRGTTTKPMEPVGFMESVELCCKHVIQKQYVDYVKSQAACFMLNGMKQ